MLFARRLGLIAGVALHPEGVDRNYPTPPSINGDATSPSTRRAWIEIYWCVASLFMGGSPSTRRAWIEILRQKRVAKSIRRRPPPGGRG